MGYINYLVKYTLDEYIQKCKGMNFPIDIAMSAVVQQKENMLMVDTMSPAYPNPKKTKFAKIKKIPIENIQGVGTELKKLLSKMGIRPTPNCGCHKKAMLMNKNGIEWCINNIDTIVGWLKEEAEKRHLPFIPTIAKLLIKRAIHNAKKSQL